MYLVRQNFTISSEWLSPRSKEIGINEDVSAVSERNQCDENLALQMSASNDKCLHV